MTIDADLSRRIEEMSKNAPPVPKAGDIYTLGTLERALRNLQYPFSGKRIPQPSPEELQRAAQAVQEASGKRVFLHAPEGNLEGILHPSGYLGVYFVHYEGSRVARHLFSPEDLKLERKEPVYKFIAASLGGCFPLYGLEGLEARYRLWEAGVKPNRKEQHNL